MDGEVDDKAQGLQEAGGQAAQGELQQQAAQKPLTGGDSNDGATATGAGMDYEALLAERDAKIAELEGTIAEAAEALRVEMDELRRQGEEQRVEFELTMAGARNVKAARVLRYRQDSCALSDSP